MATGMTYVDPGDLLAHPAVKAWPENFEPVP
jgi:hypothetical protein